jgi:hypothetical protein
MAKNLARALKTDMMADLDMAGLAQILRSRGRGNDKILAHITPKEAALLKKRGGSGTINPDTGLPEFDDGVDSAPVDQPAPTVEQPSAPAPAPLDSSFDNRDVGTMQSADVAAPSPVYDVVGQKGQFTPFTGGAPAAPGIAAVSPDQAGPSYTPGATTQPDQAGKPSFTDKALKSLTDPGTLAKLGLAGGLGAYGAYQSSQAGKQAAAATQQKQAIAAPYQQQGQQMIASANAGQLTPANQQLIQAQRARLQQASVNMGGVGQQQIESQISNLSNQLLNNQYQYGLQVLQIGDNIAIGAINSQLQIDNQLAAANKSFYSSLANLVAGSPTYVQGLTQVTPPKA